MPTASPLSDSSGVADGGTSDDREAYRMSFPTIQQNCRRGDAHPVVIHRRDLLATVLTPVNRPAKPAGRLAARDASLELPRE